MLRVGQIPWSERSRALRTLGHLLLLGLLFEACAGDTPEVGSTRARGEEVIPLLPSQPGGFGATGRFEVGDDGSASYSIPLMVPDGRRGVQPSLSLAYNSQGSDRGLGIGWALGGLSAISRCARFPAQDDSSRAVAYDDEDELCLDGRRLVPVEGSERAKDGSVYRPVRNGHERIVLHQDLRDPDSWFELWTPDGGRVHYGNADGSKNATVRGFRFSSELDGSPVIENAVTQSWLISREEDQAANYMTYSYLHFASISATERVGYETVISEIRYTGHPTLGIGERTVEFQYALRGPNANVDHYHAGFWEVSSHLVDRIVMRAPGDPLPVREYLLEYSDSPHTNRPLLDSVTLCDGSPGSCLTPVRFGYTHDESPEVQFELQAAGSTPPGWYPDVEHCPAPPAWAQPFLPADLNGDGADDLLYFEQESGHCNVGPWFGYRIRLSNGSNFGAQFDAGIPSTHAIPAASKPAELSPMRAVDLDEDGLVELLDSRTMEGDTRPGFQRWEWDGSAMSLIESDLFECGFPLAWDDPFVMRYPGLLVGDLDANGSADLLSDCELTDGVDWLIRAQDGLTHGVFTSPSPLSLGATVTTDSFLMNWDGAGTGILVHSDTDTHQSVIRLEEGTPQTHATNIPVSDKLVYLDVNGDGLPDVVDLLGSAGPELRINSGFGLIEAQPALVSGGDPIPTDMINSFTSAGDVRVADFNDDGRDDFVLLYEGDRDVQGDSKLIFLYAVGNGFVAHVRDLPAEPLWLRGLPYPEVRSWGTVQLADVDGDGEIDIVAADPVQMTLMRNTHEQPDLLNAVYLTEATPDWDEPFLEVDYARINSGRRIPSHPASEGDRILYAADATCAYPQRCIRRGMTVVESHSELTMTGFGPTLASDNHIQYEYAYFGGAVDTRGEGFVGFQRRTRQQWHSAGILEPRRDRMLTTWYYDHATRAPDGLLAFPLTPTAVEQRLSNALDGGWLRADRTEYGIEAVEVPMLGAGLVFVRPTSTRYYEWELGPGQMPVHLAGDPSYFQRRTSSVFYDAYSVPEYWNNINLGGSVDETETKDGSDPVANIFGRYSQTTETTHGGTQRVTVMDFDPATGFLRGITTNPYDPEHIHEATFTPTATSMVAHIEERAWDPDSPTWAVPTLLRSADIGYDAEEIYPDQLSVSVGGHSLTYEPTYHRGLGLLQLSIAPDGSRSEMHHDRFGRPRSVDHSGGVHADIDYSPAVLPWDQLEVHVSGSDGSYAEASIDAFGRQSRTRQRSNDPSVFWRQRWSFDNFGNVVESTLPGAESEPEIVERVDYDDLNRAVRVTHPDGTETRFEYRNRDADPLATLPTEFPYPPPSNPFIIRRIDPLRHEHQLTYDSELRVIEEEEPGIGGSPPAETSYDYGPFGRLSRVELPGGATWELHYDSTGALDRLRDPSVGWREIRRNGFGEVYQEVHADGSTTDYRYDEAGRLAKRRSADGDAAWVWDRTPFGRGHLGLTEAEDGTIEEFEYHQPHGRVDLHRVSTEEGPIETQIGYDSAGRANDFEVVGPSGGLSSGVRATYHYGSGGLLESIESRELGAEVWRAVSWSPLGFVSLETLPLSGINTERRVDPSSRTLDVVSSVQDLHVELDENLNVALIEDAFGLPQELQYDERDRIESWQLDGSEHGSYAYDDTGNVLENESGRFTYDPVTLRLDTALADSVDHDDRGRVTSLLGRELTWRDFDLLDTVTDRHSDVVRFGYTADGQRAGWASSTGERSIQAGPYRRDTDASGVVAETFRIPGPGGFAMELTSENGQPPKPRFIHPDHLGSSAVATNQSGDELYRTWHSPFGRRISATGDFQSAEEDYSARPRFTSHEPDGQAPALGQEQAGLIHMLGRDYDPVVGRFLTPDPLGPDGAGAGGWNRFSYVRNNPASLTDSNGFQVDSESPYGPWANGPAAGASAGPAPGPDPRAFLNPAQIRGAALDARQIQERMRRDRAYAAGAIDGFLGGTWSRNQHSQAFGHTFERELSYAMGRQLGSIVRVIFDLALEVFGGVASVEGLYLLALALTGGGGGAAGGMLLAGPAGGLIAAGGAAIVGTAGVILAGVGGTLVAVGQADLSRAQGNASEAARELNLLMAERPWREGAFHGPKPAYENPGHHDPRSPNFRGQGSRTSILPDDAEEVFRRAIPDPNNPGTWYGRNASGDYYRYQGSNGRVHWNGTTASERGLQVPRYIVDRFESLFP